MAKEKREILALRLTKDEIIDCIELNSDWEKVTSRRTCHSLERIKEFRTVVRPRRVRLRAECSWHDLRMLEIRDATKEER